MIAYFAGTTPEELERKRQSEEPVECPVQWGGCGWSGEMRDCRIVIHDAIRCSKCDTAVVKVEKPPPKTPWWKFWK